MNGQHHSKKQIKMDKIELIKAITSYHPGYKAGTEREWSYYIGGMTDTGGWRYNKLLDASEKDLQACLDDLIKESAPPPPLSEEDQKKLKTPVLTPYGVSNVLEQETIQKLSERMQNAILWGKQV